MVSFDLGNSGTSDRHMDNNSLAILNPPPVSVNMCEISHMIAGGKRPESRRGKAFAFSVMLWDAFTMKNKIKLTFSEHRKEGPHLSPLLPLCGIEI